MMGKSVRTQCFDRPIKPQQIGWNANHRKWHLKTNKQTNKALTIIFPLPIFTFIHRLVIETTPILDEGPPITIILTKIFTTNLSGRGTSNRHHISLIKYFKIIISQDEGPFRAGQSAMDRFLLVVQCVIGGGKVRANHFHETMKCLFAIVVARGWMTSWICQTSWNYLERLHKSFISAINVRAHVSGAPLLLFNI